MDSFVCNWSTAHGWFYEVCKRLLEFLVRFYLERYPRWPSGAGDWRMTLTFKFVFWSIRTAVEQSTNDWYWYITELEGSLEFSPQFRIESKKTLTKRLQATAVWGVEEDVGIERFLSWHGRVIDTNVSTRVHKKLPLQRAIEFGEAVVTSCMDSRSRRH